MASLLPAATDIVAGLGAAHALVAVSHECDAPAASPLPRVTRSAVDAGAGPSAVDACVRDAARVAAPLFEVDEAALAALRPDVILTQGVCDVCAVSERDVRALAARLMPSPIVVTLSATTIEGILGDVMKVARVLRRVDGGRTLADALRERMMRVHVVLKEARAPRPRVAVIEWTDPVYIAGHWVPEMVRRAGGAAVLTEPGAHSVVVDSAALERADPEIVLVAPCGYTVDRAAAEGARMMGRDEWAWLAGRVVWAMDGGALVSRPGPRVVEGVEVMAAAFHPSLFPQPPSSLARRMTLR
ncbi:MAG: ABC transporter substrate-binding protein [Gemmatimonadaceae bacterium]